MSTSDSRRNWASGHKGVTADGVFSLEEVECIGACCWAPAIQVNYDFHDELKPEHVPGILAGYRGKRKPEGKAHMPRLVSHPDEVKIVTRRFGQGAARSTAISNWAATPPRRNALSRVRSGSSTR